MPTQAVVRWHREKGPLLAFSFFLLFFFFFPFLLLPLAFPQVPTTPVEILRVPHHSGPSVAPFPVSPPSRWRRGR